MRILHIDDTFHPSYGYQCTPLAKFQAKIGNEVHIIAPEAEYMYPLYKESFGDDGTNLKMKDAAYEATTGVVIHRVKGNGFIFNRLNYDTDNLYNTIDSIHPEVILMHCMETLTAIRVIRKYSTKYPIVLDSHMLAMASRNRFAKIYEFLYKTFVTSIIKKRHLPVIIVQNDDYVNTHLGVPKKQIKFISFGTDTDLFSVNKINKETFLKNNNLPDDTFIIVSTGKLTEAKNGLLFAKSVEKKLATSRNIAIVVVANYLSQYAKNCKAILERSPYKVFYYPVQEYLKLPFFYQIADVVVFPKQVSMSFYDAQSCGTPVLSEDVRINQERNSHNNGLCFKSDDLDDFRLKLVKLVNMEKKEYESMRNNSREFITKNYSYDRIAKLYIEVLQEAYEIFHRKQYI